MIEAYEIGISLALQDGVSDGIALISRELASLDQAIAATTSNLARMHREAERTLPASTAASIGSLPATAKPTAEPPNLGDTPVPSATPAEPQPRSTPAAQISPGEIAPVRQHTTAASQTNPASPQPAPKVTEKTPMPEMPKPSIEPFSLVEPAQASRIVSAPSAAVPAAIVRAPPPAPTLPTRAPAAPQPPRIQPFLETSPRPHLAGPLPLAADTALPRHAPPRILPGARLVAAPAHEATAAADRSTPSPNAPSPRRTAPSAYTRQPSPLAGRPAVQAERETVYSDPLPVPDNTRAARPSNPPRTASPPTGAEAAASTLTPAPAAATSSFAPPPPNQAAITLQGDIILDGARVGRWMTTSLARQAARPPAGPTGPDPRQTPLWSGQAQGF